MYIFPLTLLGELQCRSPPETKRNISYEMNYVMETWLPLDSWIPSQFSLHTMYSSYVLSLTWEEFISTEQFLTGPPTSVTLFQCFTISPCIIMILYVLSSVFAVHSSTGPLLHSSTIQLFHSSSHCFSLFHFPLHYSTVALVLAMRCLTRAAFHSFDFPLSLFQVWSVPSRIMLSIFDINFKYWDF